MTHVLIFGDSITYGAWDKEGGWAKRLRNFLDEKQLSDSNICYTTYNLGISGDNTDDLLKRFDFETERRLDEGEETIFIFAIGINDCQFLHKENRFRIEERKFKENIQKLIMSANIVSSKILFVGLTPVDESKTIPIPWNTNKSYKNEYVEKYNEMIKSICKENNILFIEIFENWLKLDYKKILEYGLHPNTEGHQKLFEIVRDYLIEKNLI